MANRTTSKKAGKSGIAADGELVRIPLSQIDPTSFENQRTGNWAESVEDPTGMGSAFGELLASITDVGQKDAITVRPKAKGRHGKDVPFEIVKGFRRYAAISFIAEREGQSKDDATILAIVKDLTDTQALEENIFENTARDNLSGPDLAWAAFNLQQRYLSEGKKTSDRDVSAKMGKNQSYISRLLRVVENGPDVARVWQQAKSPLSLETLERIVKIRGSSAEETRDKQLAEYERISKETANKPNGRKGPGGKPPVQVAINSAVRVAGLVGDLEQKGLVQWLGGWSFKTLELIGVNGKDLTADDKKSVVKAAKEAYEKAVNPPSDESDESADESEEKEAAE